MTANAPPATVLAFDFGTRRIGVAVGNTLLRVARPLTTIEAPDAAARFAAIGALLQEWQPDQLIVGLPVHADGTPHAMTAVAHSFMRELAQRYGLPVLAADERYSTQAAQLDLAETGQGGRAGRAQRDAVAAQIILQAWFDQPREANA